MESAYGISIHMNESYSIQILVVNGKPDGVRVVDRPADWNGVAVVFPREELAEAISTEFLSKSGVYALWDEDHPGAKLYVGQSENVAQRLEEHYKSKIFWRKAIVFTSYNSMLNAGHTRWLEHNLIKRVQESGSRTLENGNTPSATQLSLQDTAHAKIFFNRMLEIMPITGLTAFESKSDVDAQQQEAFEASSTNDTIIVPTGKTGEGFEEVFLGGDCWYYVRLSEQSRDKLKYIAAYRPAPESAVTHLAEIKEIVPFGDAGKYKVVFKNKATNIDPKPFGTAKQGAMQGPRFCSLDALKQCAQLGEIL